MAKNSAPPAFLQFIENKTFQRLVLFLVLAYVAYRLYNRYKTQKGRTVGNDKKNLSTGKDYNAVARRLKTSMEGVQLISDNGRENAYSALLSLNDDEFIEVYNEFNKLVDPSSGTLRDWVTSEYVTFGDGGDRLVGRMDLLNLP